MSNELLGPEQLRRRLDRLRGDIAANRSSTAALQERAQQNLISLTVRLTKLELEQGDDERLRELVEEVVRLRAQEQDDG